MCTVLTCTHKLCLSKNKKKVTLYCFYSREKMKYIAWACFRSVVDKDNGIPPLFSTVFFSIRICTVLNANKAKIYLPGKFYEAIILIN